MFFHEQLLCGFEVTLGLVTFTGEHYSIHRQSFIHDYIIEKSLTLLPSCPHARFGRTAAKASDLEFLSVVPSLEAGDPPKPPNERVTNSFCTAQGSSQQQELIDMCCLASCFAPFS